MGCGMSQMPRLTLRQLSYFTALAACRTYRQAAEQLNLSQPALTEQMHALERAVGVPLFDRRQRRLVLTPTGRSFLEDARRILATVDESCARTKAIGMGLAGRIRLGLTDDFVSSRLFERILGFTDRHPDIEVETHVGLSPDLIDQLSRDMLDLGVLNLPLLELPLALTRHDLPPSRIVLLVRTDHPLAERGEVAPRELAAEPLIFFPALAAVPFAIQCRRIFEEARVEPVIAQRTNSSALAVRLTAAGYGSALMSEFSLGALPPDLTTVAIDSPQAWLQHVLIHPRDRLAEPTGRLVEALLGARAEGLNPPAA